jgi:drug/metabolite transporter (DMT)-like permease
LSLLILAIAIVALAFSPILTKLSELELSPTTIIFNRLWISTIIISCWQLIGNAQSEQTSSTKFNFDQRSQQPEVALRRFPLLSKLSKLRKKALSYGGVICNYQEPGLLLLASCSATASALLWAISFTQTSIASSTVLRSLTPLFISLGAWLILKQRFNSQFIIGMIVAIIGAMVIGWDDLQIGDDYLVGDSIALFSAALHGVNILIIGYLRDRGCTTERVLLWRCIGGSLIVLPVVLLTDNQLLPISLEGWLTVIALAVVCQTFGQGLLVFSLKQFSSSFVGIFTLLKPLVTALLAWAIFAEGISITSAIALILILFGIYLAQSSGSSAQNSNS